MDYTLVPYGPCRQDCAYMPSDYVIIIKLNVHLPGLKCAGVDTIELIIGQRSKVLVKVFKVKNYSIYKYGMKSLMSCTDIEKKPVHIVCQQIV